MELDKYDKIILQFLNKDSQITLKDLEKEVGLKVSTLHNRIKRLEQNGIIKKYIAVVDHEAIGYPLVAYIMIGFDKTDTQEDQIEVAKAMEYLERVEEVHIIAGEFDILIKVRAKNIEDLGVFVTKELKEIDGVGGSRTFVSLKSVKEYYDEPYLIDLVASS